MRTNRLLPLLGALLVSGPAPALDLPATLAWGQRVELGTPVSGLVTEVAAAPGQRVEQGQVLVRLDSRLFQARLAEAQAALEEAKQRNSEAELELERTIELYERTLLSDHDRTLAEIGAAAAEAARRKAAAALSAARLELEYSQVSAPFSGLVVAVAAAPGQAVANRLQIQPLVVLAGDAEMRALAQVSAEQAAALRPDIEIEVAVAGVWVSGRFSRLSLEPVAQTPEGPAYQVEVVFSAPPEATLRAGQQATVRIND